MGLRHLCLVPSDAEAAPAHLEELAMHLRKIGFLSEPLYYREETAFYKPGSRFLELVNFESSHPIIRLEEVEGELKPVETLDSRNCCYISFEQATPTPEFLGGPCTLDPICLDCGYSEEDWHLILDAWYPQKSEHRWTCPNCGKVQRVYDLDWQDGAALARFSIVIDPVAFREAVPGWRLMNELRQATGFTWKYFYFDDNPFNERWD